MANYDLVTVGGGVGGAAVAFAMAARGYRVLVVERETQFRDRVRGELLFPWGVAEARELGLYAALIEAGGHHPRYWTEYAGPEQLRARDFVEDTPQQLPALCIYHPLMQEALLRAAEAAGAEVRRGARVSLVERDGGLRVRLETAGGPATVAARLVVGADGRSSGARGWGGFAAREASPTTLFAGVLLENVAASAETSVCMLNPTDARMVLYFPQTPSSGRAYLASPAQGGVRLSGGADFARFLAECARSGLAEGLLDGARQAGPLATFESAESWVEHPYRGGIALVGDAAATSDPTWGQGLPLTLRDARLLRDALLADDDWESAGHAYAAAHDRCYAMVRTAESWFTQVFLQPGPEADALRAHVLPRLEADPFFLPDTLTAGPDLAPATEQHRAQIFGR
ncbi:MAG TPA: FAD-dependent monooxygenase [Chloroflexaceae bacterium]|nr:FAD-dependent monooxygenase [Chloroflexaceae bacterium]